MRLKPFSLPVEGSQLALLQVQLAACAKKDNNQRYMNLIEGQNLAK